MVILASDWSGSSLIGEDSGVSNDDGVSDFNLTFNLNGILLVESAADASKSSSLMVNLEGEFSGVRDIFSILENDVQALNAKSKLILIQLMCSVIY